MEVFESLRKHFATCGIAVSQKSPRRHPFNVKNSTVFILLCLYVSLIAVFVNDANTFDERTDILYKVVSISTCGILYEIIVLKMLKLFAFIDSLADTVDSSEP